MNLSVLLDVTLNNAATEVARTGDELSLWELTKAGQWYIMIPLAVLSVLCIYIFIERYLAIRKAISSEKNFMDKIKDFIHDGKLDAAKSFCASSDHPIARMIEKGISRIGKSMKDISVSIENVAKLEVFKLEKGLSSLATVAGAAPMIGFLGTVIGMIRTFYQMKISGSVEINQISGGIMQAMVTTVAGLIIGIIAYIAYNTLVSKVDKVIHTMEASSIDFIDLLEEPGN